MGKTFFTTAIAVGLTLGSLTAAATAQGIAPGAAMYGINRDTGELYRYRFDDAELDNVHTVRVTGGEVLTGIEGLTYIPGFQNLIAFWTNPDTGRLNLVYVNAQAVEHSGTETAHIVNAGMEGGHVTGAVQVQTDEGHKVYVVQDELTLPFDVKGKFNMANPNNSPNMRFDMITTDGQTITREHLEDPNFSFTGDVVEIRIRAMGGKNNEATLEVWDGSEWQEWTIQGNNTYVFQADPDNPIFVDNLWNEGGDGGQTMGQWWIEFQGQVTVNGEVAMSTPRRVAMVDHRDGAVIELARLENRYDSLTSVDGEVFLATRDQGFWRITVDGTGAAVEEKVGDMHPRDVLGLDFAGQRLLGFTVITDRLYSFDPDNPGHSPHGHASDLGVANVGDITFVPHTSDRGQFQALSYD